MAVEVFNRNECKFIIDNAIYEDLHERLLKYMEPDEYNREHEYYTISNIYYDTGDNHMVRNSLEKPLYKEKLRIRSYGIPNENEIVYLEIKKKVRGIVSKRRTAINLKEAYDFASSGNKPELKEYMNSQVINEIEYILKTYLLEPKIYMAYDRKALFGKEDHSLRITFDKNIRTRRYDLRLEHGDHGEYLMEDNQWLMEVKVGKNIPLWLARLFSEYRIFKTSFSKYGKEYEKTLIADRKMKGDLNICLNQYQAPCLVQPQLIHQ